MTKASLKYTTTLLGFKNPPKPLSECSKSNQSRWIIIKANSKS